MKYTIRFFALLVFAYLHASSASFAVTNTNILDNTGFYTPFTSGTAGFFASSGSLGMYANTSGNKEVVAWRTLKTAGNNTGSNRSLQVGDVFSITVNASSAFGGIGFSLNSGGTAGSSYANRTSGSRLFVQEVGTTASWEVNSASGTGNYTPLNYNVSSTQRDYNFKVYITSLTTANVLLTEGSTTKQAYNLTMNGSAGANIDAFSLWLKDDWNGSSSSNIYWKNNTIADLGFVELGYFLTSGTFTPGVIQNGLAANSTTSVSTNSVFVGGNAGTAVILNQANTYGGNTTINADAVALAANGSAFGTNGTVTVTSGGAVQLSNNITVARAITLNGTGVSSSGGALRNVSGANTNSGEITLGSNSRINSDSGTLTLDVASGNAVTGTFDLTVGGAASTAINDNINIGTAKLIKDGAGTLTLGAVMNYTGNTEINEGTLSIGSGGGLSSSSPVYLGSGLNNLHATLALAGTTTFANGVQVNTSSGAGNRTIQKTDATSQTFSGNLTNNKASTIDVISGGSLNMSGVISGSGPITKSSAGTLVLSGANTYLGNTAVNAGLLRLDNNSALGSAGTVTLGLNSSANTVEMMLSSGITNARSVNVEFGSGIKTLSYGTSGTGAQTGGITLNNSSLALNVGTGGTLLLQGGVTAASALTDVNRLALDGGGTLVVSNNGTGVASTDRYQMRIGNGTVIIASGTIVARTNISGLGHSIDLGLDLNGNAVSATSKLLASNNVTISNSIYVSTASSNDRVLGMTGSGISAFTGPIALNSAGLKVDAATNATVTFSGAITDATSSTGSLNSLTKTGNGAVVLSGANTYSGGTTISAGTLKLDRAGNVNGGGTISGTIAVNGGTLLLGQANQISDSSAVTLAGGTINTGGFADRAGKLTVSSGSSISGLVASTGAGVASASDFLFSSVDLSNYATSSGAVLDLGGGYAHGSTINFASTQASLANGWTGYSTTSLNNFQDKIAFGNTGMKAQISFNSTSGLTYVTAIPEPKVYVAAGILCVLVGLTEYRRRKRATRAV